jgi:4-hydroxy-tetrahydrodipicolinate reductase
MPIEVVIHGALGRMGREVVAAVCKDPQLKPVGAVDVEAEGPWLALPGRQDSIPLSSDLDTLLAQAGPRVVVDFSTADAAMNVARLATQRKVNVVIGTTGLAPDSLTEMDRLAITNEVGVIVAPNFALGAVVMVHLAKIAARYFDHAEIIEMHHEQKLDAPSGTALSTARAMAEARRKPFRHPETQKESLRGTRGGELDGISLHSVRLPGLMAHQEIIFGTSGQTLTIRHDTVNRECYMPGVILAIKKVVELKGLTYGLENLLGL